jgi:hypothetical protein
MNLPARRVVALVALSAFALCSSVGAQQPKAPPVNPKVQKVSQILSGNLPTGADRDFLVSWIKDNTQEMWTTDASKSVALLEEARKRIMPVTPDAKFASLYSDAFMPFMDRKASHPGAFLQVAHMMAPLAGNTTFPILKKLAAAPDSPGSRYVAWRAIHPLRQDFNSQAQDRAFMIERAGAEDSAPVLSELFRAMDVSNIPFGGAHGQTLDNLVGGLQARAKRYYGGQMTGIGGEVTAFQTIDSLMDSPALKAQVKTDLIEGVFRILFAAGVRYTQFDRETVDLLRMNQRPIRELRQGMMEVVVHGDRTLNRLLAGSMPAAPQAVDLEQSFAAVVRGFDPVELTDIELIAHSARHDLARYLPWLKVLEARRAHVKLVLEAAGVKPDMSDPGPWKLPK